MGTLSLAESDNDVKQHVVSVLPLWKAVVSDVNTQVKSETLTEGGLGKTTKLSLVNIDGEATHPAEIVLHVRKVDPFRESRMAGCQSVWARAGVSPPRLAEGVNWYVDAFDGDQAQVTCTEDAFALGLLVAKMHSADSSWFDHFRQEILRDRPVLQSSSPDASSHIWQLLSRSENRLRKQFGGELEGTEHEVWPGEDVKAFCDAGVFVPTHPVLRRTVPFHGDLHIKNIIQQRTATGITYKAIDFEFVGVGPAVVDLGMVLDTFSRLEPPLAFAEKFLEGYFRGLNLPAPEKDEVNQIWLDCRMYAFAIWADDVGYFDLSSISLSLADVRLAVPFVQAFGQRVRESPMLQEQIFSGKTLGELWSDSEQAAAWATAKN